ncbi:hypothetical protein NOVOSPHI9U_10330 [Novosphingobium sp. 9U]|nr:hypothetical protein NOVOSPHI9U_10330 [Novosphingobium sp. 9U]
MSQVSPLAVRRASGSRPNRGGEGVSVRFTQAVVIELSGLKEWHFSAADEIWHALCF